MSRKLLTLFSLLLILIPSLELSAETAGSGEQKVDLTPKIHGAFRARWEMDTENNTSRFQVRNARVTLGGMIAPSIDYYFQTDLCDRGKMKILDAWGRIAITTGLKFQAGQFRLPFGTDCFRGPGNYIFANRSFIGGTMNNVRGVGAKLSYSFPIAEASSLTLDGGAFNPTSMADHDVWVKQMAYAGKAVVALGDLKFAAGGETLIPDSVRINSFGASLCWQAGGWTVEGEYLNKHYVNSAHRAAHGYNVFVDYGFPVKAGVFNRASLQGRFDGMTAHSSGKRDKEGRLFTDGAARNRITVGATLSYIYKIVHCDVRLNYEKYFYHHGVVAAPGAGDKICAEMVVKF